MQVLLDGGAFRPRANPLRGINPWKHPVSHNLGNGQLLGDEIVISERKTQLTYLLNLLRLRLTYNFKTLPLLLLPTYTLEVKNRIYL